MRAFRRRAAASVLLVACLLSPVIASAPRSWEDGTRETFSRGEMDGVSIGSEGEIRVAPEVRLLGEEADPRLWSLAVDRDGAVWAAAGGNGRLYRVDPESGEWDLRLQAAESEVLAVAAGGGAVYAATGPEGAVYRLRGAGSPEPFFDPPDPYVWDLAVDGDGRLLVATGDAGRIYRVEPDGTASLLHDSPEPHVRTLALDSRGRLLAGTDGQGYLYRFDDAGRPSVLFVSPEGEITDVAVAEDGRILVSTLGAAAPVASPPARASAPAVTRVTVVATADEPAAGDADEPEAPVPPRKPRPAAAPRGGRSAVYALDADGDPRKLFSSPGRQVLCLLPRPDGSVLAGTAAGGRLLQIDAGGRETLLAQVPVSQITALAPAGDRILASTANPGRLLEILPRPAGRGTYLSAVKDAALLADWGRIRWSAAVPPGAALEISVRSGNTARPDDTWSDWTAPAGDPAGSEIALPPGRFLQYRALLRGGSRGGPTLRTVGVSYLERNRAPEVRSIDVLAPGVVLLSQRNQQPPDQQAVARAETEAGAATPPRSPPARKTYQDGMRTVTWEAFDPNEDPLRFDVEVRAEDETIWRSLGRDLEETFLIFDSRRLADGRYRVRVRAHDRLANPPQRARSGERWSPAVEIDNTPPAILGLQAGRGRGGWTASFQVEDRVGPLRLVAYSLDASEWIPALPEDGVPDGPREPFDLVLGDLVPGEHSLSIRAEDAAGNGGSAKVTFLVP